LAWGLGNASEEMRRLYFAERPGVALRI